jgi:hypothetical protein
MYIKENFFSADIYEKIKRDVWCDSVNWFRRSVDDLGPQRVYFTHSIYFDYVSSHLFPIMEPIIDILEIKSLIRAKLNFYPPTNKVLEHDMHIDYDFPHKGAIISFNTCDGGTFIGEKFIQSKDNRAVVFDPSIKHRSTTSTDLEGRLNLTINYF